LDATAPEDAYDLVISGDPGHNTIGDFSVYERIDVSTPGDIPFILNPNRHSRLTSASLKNFTGMNKDGIEMERLKKLPIRGSTTTINELESELKGKCDLTHYTGNLEHYFETYDALHSFYGQSKFTKAKITRRMRKTQHIDDYILKTLLGSNSLLEFMKKGLRVCFVLGSVKLRYESGLKFCSSIGSSEQLATRMQMLIRQHNLVSSQQRQKRLARNVELETLNQDDGQEYKDNTGFLRSCIDFVYCSEYCTTKTCNTCHNRSDFKCIPKITRTTDSQGVTTLVKSSTRWFRCTHRDHVGTDKVNRDSNASANIGLNLILFANGYLERTTWFK
jgi:hypothetical protein